MTFADLHIHLLYGADDGAENEMQMRDILDTAYSDGTRIICATPHYHPGYFGDNVDAIRNAFTKLKQYANKYSDLKLYLGNELRYSPNCLEWLSCGDCKTINESKYVLVDFSKNENADYIVSSTLKLVNAGYTPVLAHTERYDEFHSDMREVKQLQECGVIIQVDAQSPFGAWGRIAKKRSKKLIEHYFADVIASDAHNISGRPPYMSSCYYYVVEKCGEKYANRIFMENQLDILNNSDLGKELC